MADLAVFVEGDAEGLHLDYFKIGLNLMYQISLFFVTRHWNNFQLKNNYKATPCANAANSLPFCTSKITRDWVRKYPNSKLLKSVTNVYFGRYFNCFSCVCGISFYFIFLNYIYKLYFYILYLDFIYMYCYNLPSFHNLERGFLVNKPESKESNHLFIMFRYTMIRRLSQFR